MSEYKQCCLTCGFHYFNEDECPNCWAERVTKEYQAEWDRQLKLLSMITGIQNNRDFWMLWNAENSTFKTWFRNTCQQVAPDIYDWYQSIENERMHEQFMEPQQLGLFEEQLPF